MAFLQTFNQELNKAFVSQRVTSYVQPEAEKPGAGIEKAMRSVVPTAYEQGQKNSTRDYGAANTQSTFNPEEGRTLRPGTLRKMYYYNPIVKIAVDTIINTVCSAPYKITVAEKDAKQTKEHDAQIKEINTFFKSVNTNRESFRTILEMVVRDLVVLDGGAIEKVRENGKLKEIWAVDSASILPVTDVHRRLKGYQQLVNQQVVTTYKPNDLIYMMMNPRTESLFGISPLECLYRSVTAFIYAESYNLKYFENNHVPKGILDLGPNIPEDQLDRFKNFWEAETSGKPHRIMVLGGPIAQGADNRGVQWIPLQINSKDMELLEYLKWLERLILAVFGVSPSEVGFTESVSGAPATGQLLQSSAFRNKAIYPMLDRIANYFTQEIIYEEFKAYDLKFEFIEEVTLDEKMKKAQLHQIEIGSGVKTVNEIRKEEGLKPLEKDEQGNVIEPQEEEVTDTSSQSPNQGEEDGTLETTEENKEIVTPEKEKILQDSIDNLTSSIKLEKIKRDLSKKIQNL